ncbi:MAG TPA: XrtA system polysaccharide chain length determinant [Candidatus Sulfotelmatobacter sp.]|nr:XrtA system polysaccharide chain length determinant [Candidatus Sulfotelmatobacter sp.]
MIDQVLDYLRGMWRRRVLGIAAAWAIAIGGVIFVMGTPDQYEASARMYVDTQSVLKPLMSGLAVQPDVDQQVAMLSRTLLSRPNVERLVRMADLDLNLKSQDKRDALIDGLIRAIDVKGLPGDNLYSIRYRDSRPDRARRVVDSLLSIFVESGLGNKRRDTEKAQQFIDEQIKEYERRLEEAERRLKEFKLRNLTAFGGADALSAMQRLESQIGEARIELRAAEDSRDVLKRELAGEEPIFLPDTSITAAGPEPTDIAIPELDTRISTMKTNLDELLRRYTEAHPDVVSTRRIIGELEQQRKEQIEARRKALPVGATGQPHASSVDRNPVYQQLKLSLADAEANVAALRGRAAELDARYNQVKATARLKPEIEEELVQLNRDYQVQKQNYDGLVARRESAQLTSQMEQTASVADFRIVDPPRVSPTPVAPNRLMLLLAVLGLSIGGGAAVSLAISQIFPTFYNTRGLRRVLQRPVLGAVTLQEVKGVTRRRRVRALAFLGGLAGLFALYGSVLAVLLLTTRGA